MYIVYGADKCPYCKKAKELLEANNKEYVYYDITNKKTETMDELAPQTNNQRTVPIVFDGEKFIGGFNELSNVILFENNEDF